MTLLLKFKQHGITIGGNNINTATNKTKCIICGKNFDPKVSHHKQHCSDDCCKITTSKKQQEKYWRNKPNKKGEIHTKQCPYCHNKFTTTNYHQKYCSKECCENYYKLLYNKEYKRNTNIYNKICTICNNPFTTNKPNQVRCSQECRDLYTQNLKIKKIKKCVYCEKEFNVKSSNHKFCSKECYKNYLKEQRQLNKKDNSSPIKLNIILPINYDRETSNDQNIFNGQIIDMRGISRFSKELRKQILKRDDYKCYICSKNTNLHIHHIIPRSQGGSNNPSNLITLCGGCHRSIEAGDMENAILKCTQRAINNINI